MSLGIPDTIYMIPPMAMFLNTLSLPLSNLLLHGITPQDLSSRIPALINHETLAQPQNAPSLNIQSDPELLPVLSR
jgi:hypothetical protein